MYIRSVFTLMKLCVIQFFVMIEEVPKKPRARASLDGKRLKPVLSEAQQSRIIAERSRLHERAKVLLESDRMSQGLYDTFTDAVNASGSLQELRGVDIDLDKYADQPIDDTAEATAPATESTAESVETDENAETYVAQLYRNKDHVYWYVDKNDAVVELDEDAKIERERQSADPDSPPRAGYPKFSTMAEKKEIPASGSEEVKDAHEPNPTDVDELKRKLEEKNEKKRKKITKELAKKTDKPQSEEEQPRTRARESHQDLHDLLTGDGETLDEQPSNARDTGGSAGAPPNQPPSDALRQSTGNNHEDGNGSGTERKKYEYKVDKRDYLGLDIMSVQSIIHDPAHAHFFGEMVHTIAPEMSEGEKQDNPGRVVATEVLARYNAGTATTDDMSFMKYAAHEYTKWNVSWEKLVAQLTDTDVEAFMRRNEMLDNIAAHVGGTRGKEKLVHALRLTAMRDQATFKSIEDAVHHMHEVRGSYLGRKAEGKIEALADRVGIKREDFENVFDFSTPEAEKETHAQLVELFRRNAGRGRKVMDWLSRGAPSALVGSSEIAADNAIRDAKLALGGRFGRTGKQLSHLGDTLERASADLSKVVGTQDMIDEIATETLTNERMRPGSEAGPLSFADVRQKDAEIAPPALEKMLTEKMNSDPNWKTGTPAYRASEIQRIKQEATKNLKTGTGFWSLMLRILFGAKFDKAATNAQRAAGATH